jgi:hypothetical protein
MGDWIYGQPLPINAIEPILQLSTITSEEDTRFFDPAEVGIPVGDLDGDGKMDYIGYWSPFFDFRTDVEQPFSKTLIKSYTANGDFDKYRILEDKFYPAGDLDGDGNSELIWMENGSASLYSFTSNGEAYVPSMVELQTVPTITDFNTIRANKDLDGDGVDDLLICKNEFGDNNDCEILFGNSSDPTSPQLVSIDLSQFGLDIEDPYQITVDRSLTGTNNSIYFFGRPIFNQSVVRLTEVSLDNADRVPTLNFQSDFNILRNEAPTERRYFVKDVDGDGESEILASDNREFFLGAGFRRIYFNDPLCEVLEIDYSGEEPEIQPSQLINNNCVINVFGTPYQTPSYAFSIWTEGNLSLNMGLNTSDGTFSMTMPLNDDQSRFPNRLESVMQALEDAGYIIHGAGNPETAMRGIATTELSENPYEGIVQELKLRFENRFAAEARRVIPQRKENIQEGDPIANIQVPNGNSALLGNVFYDANGNAIDLSFSTRVELPAEEQIDNENVETRRNELNFVELMWRDLNSREIMRVHRESQGLDNPNKINNVFVDSVQADFTFDFSTLDSFSDFGGIVIRNIGDIDGNTGEEILVGSGFSADTLFNNLSKFWIFLGSNTDFSGPDLTFELINDSTITSTSNIGVGFEVANLGDVNGDGFNDFALGLENFGDDFNYTGAVYVYAGQNFTSQNKSVTNPSEPIAILRPDTVAGQTIRNFGTSVSGGDFDGDGFNDIAVVSQSGSGNPAPPTVQIFKGGTTLDAEADYFLYATEEDFGGTDPDTVSGLFSSFTVEFMPKEGSNTHQDLYLAPGGFSIFPDAVIFRGGSEPSTTPSVRLAEPGPTPTSSGTFQGSKPVAGDFNGDGFYEVFVEKQFDNRDGVVSSRILVFSPNSDLNVSINEDNQTINTFKLEQNYPNPFNPSTNIQFQLPAATNVTLKIYNILGQEVATLLNNERLTAGLQTVPFNASSLASGVYLYRLEAGSFVQTRKMTLIK